ncbi:MAG: DUF4340 domain-containing protein [Rhodospirillales bacterium]|nr:DUF4340 domain-containing protein [Rhodospirillales bacterium]
MKPRTSAILAAIAVLVLGAGWYFGPHQNPTEHRHVATTPLFFPGLAPRLGKAAEIEIAHAGKRFVILRKGDVWGLPDRGFYPVEPTKVHAMLAGLTLLRRLGPRTADPTQFATLGLADPTKPGSTGSLVTVSDAAGHPIVSLIVGHQRYPTTGATAETLYVRRPGGKRSWLAEGPLSIDGEEKLWISHSIVNISHHDIVHVTVARGAENLAFALANGKLALVSPAKHPPLGSFKIDSVWRALEFLSFSSVQPGPALPGKEFARSVFTTKGGMVIAATLAREGKDLWARFSATGNGKRTKPLAAKFGTWAYRLGAWRESELAPSLADLVKKAPAAASPAAASPAAASPAATASHAAAGTAAPTAPHAAAAPPAAAKP